MIYQNIPPKTLRTWVTEYSKNREDKTETKNVIIRLGDLQRLMSYINEYNAIHDYDLGSLITGIRIYVIRTNEVRGNTPSQVLNQCRVGYGDNEKKLPQFSLAITPIIKYVDKTDAQGKRVVEAQDLTQNGTDYDIILTPNPGETSGLCPNNCGGSIDGNT